MHWPAFKDEWTILKENPFWNMPRINVSTTCWKPTKINFIQVFGKVSFWVSDWFYQDDAKDLFLACEPIIEHHWRIILKGFDQLLLTLSEPGSSATNLNLRLEFFVRFLIWLWYRNILMEDEIRSKSIAFYAFPFFELGTRAFWFIRQKWCWQIVDVGDNKNPELSSTTSYSSSFVT